MIDMKELISDLWLDKWIDSPVVKILEDNATKQQWMPVVRRPTTVGSPVVNEKVIELIDVDPTVLRIPARFHPGIVLLCPGKTLLRKATNSSLEGEVMLHQSMFEDPHNVTQDELALLRMTHPELFTFAPLFHQVVRSAMIEATRILKKEGNL